MGIPGLAGLLRENASDCIQQRELSHYRGYVLAIDISVTVHQFLTGKPQLTNREGDDIRDTNEEVPTRCCHKIPDNSHLNERSVLKGLFDRTVHLLEHRIKPVYVFDGQPPKMKRPKPCSQGSASGQRRIASGAFPEQGHRGDMQKMLRHLGVPFIQAPGEAEATCAALVASGKAWGTVTEDMDALPFGSTRLIRNLKASKNKNIEEYDLHKILMKLKMSHEQFVDLCILLGCDYSGKIRGLGPKKALRMMQEHGSIERILGALSPQKQTFSGDFPYVAVRQLFLQPDVVDVKSVELLWQEVNKEAVVQFLTNEKYIKKIDVRLDKLCATGQSKKRKHVTAPVSPSSNKQKKMTHYYAVKKSVT